MSGSTNLPEWIRMTESLTADEIATMDDHRGHLLRIDDSLAFDMKTWADADTRRPNSYAPLPKKHRDSLLGSILDKGVEVPVDLDASSFDVVDGHHRMELTREARQENRRVPFAGFNLRRFHSEEDRRDFEDRRAFVHRQLTRSQKQEKIWEFLRRHPNWSDSRIGAHLQVTGDTVQKQSRLLEESDPTFTRPEELLDVNDRPMQMANLKKTSKTPEEKLEVDGDISGLGQGLLDAWWEEFGLVVVFVKDLATMAKKRDLVVCEERPTAQIPEKGIQKLLAGVLSELEGQPYKKRRVLKRHFTQNRYVYQLLPDKDWSKVPS